MQQSNKGKKTGFFGASEDEDSEPSIYFQTPFRPDKDMMSSASPNQLSGFGSNIYSQPPSDFLSGPLSNIGIQQRGMSNAQQFQRNVTPTSIGPPNFPIGLPPQQASPNRNLFTVGQRGVLNAVPQSSQSSISQIKRPNPITAGLMSNQPTHNKLRLCTYIESSNSNSNTSITSSAMAAFRSHGDGSQPSLDLSEFPTLGNRGGAPPNPTPAARNYGMVSKPAQDPAPEFQIQQEDFPALPGAQNPPSSSTTDNIPKTPTSSPGISSYEQALSKDGGKFPGDKSGGNQPRRGIQTHPDGTVSNIPSGMVTDQFGMVGLLTFIRAADTDPNLVALAPGIDLTTLGLNLNSPENLYSTFQSPWADSPCRPQDIVLSDFHVPSEYLTNIFIRDKLAPIKLNRYTEDLLFFLFYMNGGDVLQLAAAAELYNRDWRYHKEERVWITRVPGMEAVVKTTTYERGTYYFFDAQNWRKVAKEFRLEYDKLEDRPHLPPTLLHNPNQPPPAVLSH